MKKTKLLLISASISLYTLSLHACIFGERLTRDYAQSIAQQHEASIAKIHHYERLLANSAPSRLLKQQRAQIAQEIAQKDRVIPGIERDIQVRKVKEAALQQELVKIRQEIRALQNDLNMACNEKAKLKESKNDWMQRSNAEKIKKKLADAIAQARTLQCAFNKIPYSQKDGITLSTIV